MNNKVEKAINDIVDVLEAAKLTNDTILRILFASFLSIFQDSPLSKQAQKEYILELLDIYMKEGNDG